MLLDDITEPVNAAAVSDRILQMAYLLPPLSSDVATIAASVSEQIVAALTEPIMIEANRIHSGATVGISVYGKDSPDAEAMLAHADVALYQAKAEQRGTYRFFSAGMDAEVRARVSLSTELREALATQQFFLMYQPQVDMSTGRVLGMEALVRWRHPTETLGRAHCPGFLFCQTTKCWRGDAGVACRQDHTSVCRCRRICCLVRSSPAMILSRVPTHKGGRSATKAPA